MDWYREDTEATQESFTHSYIRTGVERPDEIRATGKQPQTLEFRFSGAAWLFDILIGKFCW